MHMFSAEQEEKSEWNWKLVCVRWVLVKKWAEVGNGEAISGPRAGQRPAVGH